jgi:hypothetical protein
MPNTNSSRERESTWWKDLACWLGFHSWYPMEAGTSRGSFRCAYCSWCTEIRFNES